MSETPEGLLVSLRGFATTVISLLRTRLELLKLEAHEEIVRLSGLALWGIAAALSALVGIVFFAIFFTVLFWDTHRLLVLGIFSLLFLAAAAVAVFMTLRLARQGSRMFATSLAELRRDEAALSPVKDNGPDVPS